MNKTLGFAILFFIIAAASVVGFIYLSKKPWPPALTPSLKFTNEITATPFPGASDSLNINVMRAKKYPGSNLKIEQTLPRGTNYSQYLVSYLSEGLKIYALLTVPQESAEFHKPKNGWPVIIFNHGYIAPRTYQTFPAVGQYATYLPVFAEQGYIVFKPDYRGNGNSEGQPEGAYYSAAYATDDLNAISSIKKYKDANPSLIGVWGHSMGGNIALRDLVVDPKDIKAAVIWGGVVGSYDDLTHWHDPAYHPSAYELSLRNRHRSDLFQKYGSPSANPAFWNAIDPTNFVSDITAPVQLHAGEDDEEVPPAFSQHLYSKLKQANKTAEFYTYPGDNHNISESFNLAMQRSLAFFDKYLKEK